MTTEISLHHLRKYGFKVFRELTRSEKNGFACSCRDYLGTLCPNSAHFEISVILDKQNLLFPICSDCLTILTQREDE